MDDDVIGTSCKFSANNYPFSISMEPINFILGTNVQQYKVHIMIKVKVKLTYAKGHR